MNKQIITGCLVLVSIIIVLVSCCGLAGYLVYKSYITSAEEILGGKIPEGFFLNEIAFKNSNRFIRFSKSPDNFVIIAEGALAKSDSERQALEDYISDSISDNSNDLDAFTINNNNLVRDGYVEVKGKTFQKYSINIVSGNSDYNAIIVFLDYTNKTKLLLYMAPPDNFNSEVVKTFLGVMPLPENTNYTNP
ncbi:MAG: hypothetical protein AB1782_18780 [Cyanobacteriota bacterium]